jgi:hypothetical protein
MGKDILNEIMAQIRAAAPNLPQGCLEATALKIRRDWGGASAYIKKAPAEGKVWRGAAALAAGAPLDMVILEMGCTKQHAYRLLKRRWSRR